MAKRTNKSVSSVPVVESSVSEVSETTLSDVLGPVSSEVSDTVSEVLSEVLNEVFSETPTEVVEAVPVTVPNHLLPNFNRWLTSTLERKANGNRTPNGKKLGRPITKTDKVCRLIRLKGETSWKINTKGRPPLFSTTYQISVPKDLVITAETRFNVDLTTGDWSVVVPEEVRETLAA